MKKLLGAASALALLTLAAPAFAATSDTATATANIITPLSVTASGSLNFGNILGGAGAGGGTVVVDNVAVRSAGTIAGSELLAGSPATVPTFTTTGDTTGGATYQMAYTTAPLTGAGTPMPLAAGTASNTSTALSGVTAITIGGTLTVNAAQAPGVYTGSITATATYN